MNDTDQLACGVAEQNILLFNVDYSCGSISKLTNEGKIKKKKKDQHNMKSTLRAHLKMPIRS